MTAFKQFNSNETTSRLSLKSKKQHIRLWYECFQICKSDPSLSNNLKNSSDFYEEWGDVSVKFDEWWNDNLSWTYKTNKDGKRIKDGYILDQGEDVFITDWINTKKN